MYHYCTLSEKEKQIMMEQNKSIISFYAVFRPYCFKEHEISSPRETPVSYIIIVKMH